MQKIICKTMLYVVYYISFRWGIAKLVRHGSLNPAFVGSNPATPAKKIKRSLFGERFFVCIF